MPASTVRGILLANHGLRSEVATELVPTKRLAEQLDELDADAQRRAGGDYVALWARTFRPLVRHLQGQPEHALGIWASEVYPYLRGAPRAARLEPTAPGSATLWMADDLPVAYLEGLVEAFVALTGATARCRRSAPERFEVTYDLAATRRLVRLARRASDLRLPVLASAGMATGIGLAAAGGGLARSVIILAAVLAIQLGAIALHRLRRGRDRGPFAPRPGLTTGLLWATLVGGWSTAVLIGGFLAWATPLILPVGLAGLGLAWLYPRIQDHGLAPLLAAAIHGPVLAIGAHHAADGSLGWTLLGTGLLALPAGALAAALFYLNDLADRPLDHATGRRTLLVRLHQGRHAPVYAMLLAIGLVAAAVWLLATAWLLAVAAAAIVALWATLRVVRFRDDPPRLAPARVATIAVQATVAASLILIQVFP